jgi:hypothetical protein
MILKEIINFTPRNLKKNYLKVQKSLYSKKKEGFKTSGRGRYSIFREFEVKVFLKNAAFISKRNVTLKEFINGK